MRKILKHFVIDTITLYLISNVTTGLAFENGLQTLIFAGIGLTLASMIVKPIINILMLPLNLITFGVFRFITAAVILYLVTLVVPGFSIHNFVFAGFENAWFKLPYLEFTGLAAIVAFSLLQSFISSLIFWLVK